VLRALSGSARRVRRLRERCALVRLPPEAAINVLSSCRGVHGRPGSTISQDSVQSSVTPGDLPHLSSDLRATGLPGTRGPGVRKGPRRGLALPVRAPNRRSHRVRGRSPRELALKRPKGGRSASSDSARSAAREGAALPGGSFLGDRGSVLASRRDLSLVAIPGTNWPSWSCSPLTLGTFRLVDPAGAAGLEPATPGFGDRCSAS
jgi:hypothetical protein